MTNKLLGRYYTVINLIAQLMCTSFFKIHFEKNRLGWIYKMYKNVEKWYNDFVY